MSKRKGITISLLKDLLAKARSTAKANNRTLSNQVEEWIKEKLAIK